MEKQKNKCFIYHKNGVILNTDEGSFCDLISNIKFNILSKMKDREPITIIYNDVENDILDFWFTDILNESGHKTEYHIKIKEHED